MKESSSVRMQETIEVEKLGFEFRYEEITKCSEQKPEIITLKWFELIKNKL